jgi:hypothetical protein
MPSLYTFDKELQLKDSYAVTSSAAAQVSSADKVLTFTGSAFTRGDVVIDVTALDVASGDEKYTIELQLSDSATFASGVVVAASLPLGDSSTTGNSADTTTGRFVLPATNRYQEYDYLYGRLYTRVAGTSPTITYSAYLGKVIV